MPCTSPSKLSPPPRMKAFSKKMWNSMYAPIGTMPVSECSRRRTKWRRSRSSGMAPPVAVVSIAMASAYVLPSHPTNQ